MRTTLDIENDVLAAAKQLARQQNVAVGKVISKLVRDALTGRGQDAVTTEPAVAGFRPFPSRGKIVTDDDVEALRDQESI